MPIRQILTIYFDLIAVQHDLLYFIKVKIVILIETHHTSPLMKKLLLLLLLLSISTYAQKEKFNHGWFFRVDSANTWSGDKILLQKPKPVTLPHDWSIDFPFDLNSPSGNRGAALRGGLGLYEKSFTLPKDDLGKNIFIIFDGVYMNSTVTINGHTLGTRPFGYISFEYDLTPFLKFNGEENTLTVRVENKQPNSRWYSGSGIYRNVWLDKRGPIYVKNWGTYLTTPKISSENANVHLETQIVTTKFPKNPILRTSIFSPSGVLVHQSEKVIPKYTGTQTLEEDFNIKTPILWDTEHPHLYRAVSEVVNEGKILHTYTTTFGIRDFRFDKDFGFFLNNKTVKIIGASMHSDLGALGTAINVSAMQRQLKILKGMGINGIRTTHNPPAPELLDLCDQMGFLVMDETFDAWTWDKENTPFNYNLYFADWHERDLSDHIQRDRNHPSVILWSIGNEIPEQYGENDNVGTAITKDLVAIVKKYDTSRPVSAGLNMTENTNNLYRANALDVLGINYHHKQWKDLGKTLFPGNKPFILAEAVSALASRGHYDMPSDSIRRWAGFTTERPGGNKDFTVSSYENASVPWGSTNEEAIKLLLKYPKLSGMFLWTGFDYLGEPTPYPFPARSSYFGIVDLAGFPKDSYYLYKSIFTKENVLHILPHWNWIPGQKIDVHIYFNNANEVELYLNGKSLGKKSKQGDDLFVRFNGLTFEPGTLKAVTRKNGKKVMESIKQTAGKAYKLHVEAEQTVLLKGGEDLGFVKISVLDKNGILVPDACPQLHFKVKGTGSIAALDNGYEADLEPFSNKEFRKAYNGLALAIIRTGEDIGDLLLEVEAEGLKPALLKLKVVGAK